MCGCMQSYRVSSSVVLDDTSVLWYYRMHVSHLFEICGVEDITVCVWLHAII